MSHLSIELINKIKIIQVFNSSQLQHVLTRNLSVQPVQNLPYAVVANEVLFSITGEPHQNGRNVDSIMTPFEEDPIYKHT